MRIIAGKNRGRTLIAPKNDARPTLDRTKETLFNILQFDLDSARVLDLFAGSGALGLEAYSRGAEEITFVDVDGASIKAIQANCAAHGCNGEILKLDFVRACEQLSKRKFDVVFIDPPYDSEFYVIALQKLLQHGLLDKDAIVACEHSIELTLPDRLDELVKNEKRSRKVGKVYFTFYDFIG